MNQRDLIQKYGNPVSPHGSAGWRVPDVWWCNANLGQAWVTMDGQGESAVTPVLVNVLIAPDLELAFDDCIAACEWFPKQFYCWSPRHKLLDPGRELSLHAWGLAFDVDWDDNAYGTRGTLPATVVDIFKQHGFAWGGDWSVPDPMHFQWGDL